MSSHKRSSRNWGAIERNALVLALSEQMRASAAIGDPITVQQIDEWGKKIGYLVAQTDAQLQMQEQFLFDGISEIHFQDCMARLERKKLRSSST